MPDGCLVRQDAPALFALCDRIADKVGSPRADGILVNGDYNAAFARVGMPRKTLLIIGLPMWLVQTWPERVATLAHEFSHGANGDCTRGLLVGSALDALEHWLDFLRPEYDSGSGAIVGNHLLWILSWPVHMLHLGLSHLVWSQSQLAEFLADYLAITVAGSEAMIDDLRKIANGSHLGLFASKSILGQQQSGREVIEKFVSYYEGLPKGELERLKRLSNQENARLDSTHPPTRQRIEFIAAHPELEPAIIVNEADQVLIQAELENEIETVGRQMICDWAPEL
ncbi:MAG: M48 family metallopeptidase [Pseudomonadota bacterium]